MKKNVDNTDGEAVFKKFLKETGNLSKAMDLMSAWVKENVPESERGVICTNNHCEEDLEYEILESRLREYGKIAEADKLHEERLLIKKNRRGSAPPSCKVCGYYAKCQIRIDLYGNDDTYSESKGEQE
jgi:hypothetical protein